MIRLHRRQRFVEDDNPCDYNDREGNEPSPQRRDVEVVLALCQWMITRNQKESKLTPVYGPTKRAKRMAMFMNEFRGSTSLRWHTLDDSASMKT